ncbi:MAG: alpha/beta hydrolase [Amycolatopsis sp.]|uniref:alpha/beta fold hydrolase n=1 Tax=Amycolatopsis sp. TaxID=37632 RepID=UPI0026198147|nr:alpha/beta fold hydrolase [Amycolatopsis sp.]MCU1683517.1 alpha/beta hydrolase [Amycolatopsis sp.]
MTGIYRSEAGARAIQQRYRELLDSWPVDAEERRIPTSQGVTFVVVSGPEDAAPLVVLQGSGANSAMLMPSIKPLAEHHRVYSIDVIGEPGFSAPSRPPMTSDAYARWLDEVLDALGLTSVFFLGTSLGGWMSIDYATRRSERVTRLALLVPAGIGRQKLGVLVKFVLMLPFGEWGRRRSMMSAIGASSEEARKHPLIVFSLLVFKHFKPRVSVPAFDDGTLRRLTMPVLAVAGARDKMIDAGQTKRRLENLVPHAEVHLMPEDGHFLSPQTDRVLGFLADAEPVVHDG